MVNVKILGISTSCRHANTEIAVKWALESAAELPGVETEFISLAGKKIYPCNNCYRCLDGTADNPCPGIQQDDFKEICLKMIEPDGFIMGAMVDYLQAGALWHCLKSRLMCLSVGKSFKEALRTKAFGAIAIASAVHGGQYTALQQMIMWAILLDMHVVACGPEKADLSGGFLGVTGSTCMTRGAAEIFRNRGPLTPNTPEEKEAIREDKACFRQCVALGKRVAEAAKVVKAGYAAVSRDEIKWPKGSLIQTGEAYDYFKGK